MSLTNDMLNHLEKRRTLSENNALFGDLEVTASNKSYYFTYAAYIGVVFLVIAIISCIFNFNLHHSTMITVQTQLKIPAMHFATTKKDSADNTQAAAVKTPASVSRADQAIQTYQDAMALLSQNQTTAAIEKLENVLDIMPSFQDARTSLATLYIENNDLADATQLLKDGLNLEPDNLQLSLLLARTQMMGGNNQAALTTLNSISDAAGNNATFVDLLAAVQASLGNYSEAISLYQALLKQDPTNDRWLISLGDALAKNNQKSDALAAYQKANTIGELPADLQSYVSKRIHDLGG